ncbi:glucohydrolase [Paenibacillus sambharensis]|uniref:oligo-1,6-glucosidase n=1 Tax=Paenibacillus sambharensis TaxID=1803190 RepID=A0A2W1LEA5_9BACL|nr:alpha-glucosidase [Paenibacillus sambharensis]PZD96999.1 glucohydrolase [Paenibacillus sambharensis]
MEERQWWKESVVYEIYPRSFKDSNGDGVGDLGGILEKLDYLEELGVETLWITPVYSSPNADYGYDIRDHYRIAGEYGSMADFELLLDEIHKRGMKLLMDLVVNHTSDEHPWFIEARSSADNPYRDYYIWRPGKEDGSPPNNWLSYLGESVWTYDPHTREYYFHLYSRRQPDLNWDNPKVRREMRNIIRFWLDKGIDGFRIDAVNVISKESDLPDAERSPEEKLQANGEPHYKNGPNIHTYLKELHEVFSQYPIVTAGETSSVTIDDVKRYTSPEQKELDMVLMIEASKIADPEHDMWEEKQWTLTELKSIVKNWQQELHGQGWIGLYLSNHDHPRLVSYLGHEGEYREASAKLLATLLLTLRGTPFIYQGEELGMTNADHLQGIEDFKEQQALAYFRTMVLDKGHDEDQIMQRIRRKSRDNARTPLQWENSREAGFTDGIPWMPVNPNYKEIHAAGQLQDNRSVLNYYKRMIALRRANRALVYGCYTPLLEEHEQLLIYKREYEDEQWLIIMNFSEVEVELELSPELIAYWKNGDRELLIHNYEEERMMTDETIQGGCQLKPYEAMVWR